MGRACKPPAGKPSYRGNWTLDLLTNPCTTLFFSPPSQECVQCIRDQGVSFIRHLGNIPSGRLTSPLRGARFSFTTSSVAPADQRFARAVVTTLLALGACSVFFLFFLILRTAENDAETPSRWLGEGQEPSLMTAECRGAVCLSVGVSLCFLLTVLLRVKSKGLSHVFSFSSFY